MGIKGCGFAKQEFSAFSEVILVSHLDLGHGVLYVGSFLIKFRLVDRVFYSLLFLLEVAFHLESAFALQSGTESVSFRLVARSSRSSVMVHESVSMSRLGSESSGADEFLVKFRLEASGNLGHGRSDIVRFFCVFVQLLFGWDQVR